MNKSINLVIATVMTASVTMLIPAASATTIASSGGAMITAKSDTHKPKPWPRPRPCVVWRCAV